MQKVYVGILLAAFFCSMNAMEVGLPALLASLDKSLNFEERLKEKKKAFEEAIERRCAASRRGYSEPPS